jgi:hypothetical protein
MTNKTKTKSKRETLWTDITPERLWRENRIRYCVIGALLNTLLPVRTIQSRSPSLRSSGRNARLWDNPLPEAKNPG